LAQRETPVGNHRPAFVTRVVSLRSTAFPRIGAEQFAASALDHQLAADESAGRRLARYAVGVWYVAVFGLALAGIPALGCRLLRPPWLWGLLLCLSFTAMHAVYWSNLRMRAPLMPVVCLAAAVGVKRIAKSIIRSDRGGSNLAGLRRINRRGSKTA
jgi:hypothetical protein